MPVVVTVDGNIGTGKTTLLKHLHERYGYKIIEEPVESWKPFLENMYKKNKGFFEFQLQAWLDMAWTNRIRQENSNHSIVVIERSPLFTREVFVDALALTNKISDHQLRILDDCYSRTSQLDAPDIQFYLRLPPEISMQRIQKRGRTEENSLNADYVTLIHELHEHAFDKFYCMNQKRPIHMVDASQSTEDMAVVIDSYIKSYFFQVI